MSSRPQQPPTNGPAAGTTRLSPPARSTGGLEPELERSVRVAVPSEPPAEPEPPARSAISARLGRAIETLPTFGLASAMRRQDFFDVARVIRRLTLHALMASLLVAAYVVATGALRWIGSLVWGAERFALEPLVALAIAALAYFPLRRPVEQLLDGYFRRGAYDFKAIIARITTQAQSTLDLDEMLAVFLDAVGTALHPRFMYVLTRQPDGLYDAVATYAAFGALPVPELRTFADDPLLASAEHDMEVHYTPATGLTCAISPLAALGAHYRVPLQVGEEVVGFVILGPKRSESPYTEEDRELLAAARLPLSSAIKTASLLADALTRDRLDQELARARAVQVALLPRAVPELPGFAFAASSVPCYEASGDYYDFLPLGDGRLGIAVADVAGKGLGAAMTMAMTKSALFNQLQADPEVLGVLHALNRLLFEVNRNAASRTFTTCCYAVLDPQAMRLRFACAGHMPPMHYDAAAGRVTELPLGGGFPLGVREHSRYPAYDLALKPGDVLLFYTDGLTETASAASADEPFETERLAAVLTEHHGESAEAIHAAILEAVAAFGAGAEAADDVTLVVIKAL